MYLYLYINKTMKVTFRISSSLIEIQVEGINILYAFVHELQEKYPQYKFRDCNFIRGTKYIELTTPLVEGDTIYVIL